MLGSTFTFNGKNSSEFGIKVIKHDELFPAKIPRKMTIPGRHGKFDFGNNTYEERLIKIRCVLEKELSRAELREVAAWLSQKGNLTFWDEEDKYYIGAVYDSEYFETMPLERFREWNVVFVCEPFAVGRLVIQPLSSGLNPIDYKGTIDTPTKIFLLNTSESSVIGITITLVKRRRK